jgi:hypothetical protein
MKQLALVLLLVAGVALAQVPVTRWHSDVDVWLPFHAMLIPATDCGNVTVSLEVEVLACYAWGEERGQYVVMLGSFLSRGYELVSEEPSETRVVSVFRSPGGVLEGMAYQLVGSRVLIAAFRP